MNDLNAPFFFVDHAAIRRQQREQQRSRIMRGIGITAFIVFAVTIGFFVSTEPVEAQPVECMACLTDPANDLPATKGDVYQIDIKTQDNAEAIALEKAALESMIETVKVNADRRMDDIAAVAGLDDARALDVVRSDIGRLNTRIDDVDRSSKRRDAAIMATPDLNFGLGDRYAVNVAIGSAGGQNAVGVAAGTQIVVGQGSLYIQAGAGTDTTGDEVVGRVSIGGSW